MIIELVGLPGSGKSTMARALLAQHHGVLVRFQGKVEIVYYFFRHLVSNPLVLGKGFLLAVVSCRSVSEFWNRYVVRYARQKKGRVLQSDQLIVIDEGPLQNFYSHPKKVFTKAEAASYCKGTTLADVVLHVQIPEADRQSRLETRKGFVDKDYEHSRYGFMKENDQLLHACNLLNYCTVSTVDDAHELIRSKLHRV